MLNYEKYSLTTSTFYNIQAYRMLAGNDTDTFEMNQLEMQTVALLPYLEPGTIKHLYLFHYHTGTFCLFHLKILSF